MGKKKPDAMKKNSGGQGALCTMARALSHAYGKVPVFPYLDRATSLILIVSVLGYLGLTAYIYFSTSPAQIEAALVEGKLEKNSLLLLSDGESYVYFVESPDGKQTVSYTVHASVGCSGVMVAEKTDLGTGEICILKNGFLPDSGINTNYGNQSILLFSPWMLAASENFSWRVDTVYKSNGLEMSFPAYFASEGETEIAGRNAYEITVGEGAGGSSARFFVDAEKRVLLYADLGNVTVKMVSAPFELNWSKSG
jgi:hypothetical protein